MGIKLFDLTGKNAFITGGAQGIGKAIALAYADFGANVAIVDLDMEKAEQTCSELREKGVKALAVKTDVTNPGQVDDMVRTVVGEFGGLDIAVNNAGIANLNNAEDISYEDWLQVIDVNLNGVFLTARAAGKVMLQQKSGSIISTASMSSSIINVPQKIANYCASKAGVKHLTKALAVEWAPHNVRVNCISPGYIGTELVASMTDYLPGWTEKTPMGRIGSPEDLIGAYVYLASDASQWTTGSDLVVDGGYTCL
ncbi:Dihydroanticapsin 7-dehydrogenase [Pontiella desulfatans]|uniref:Dihydroanticapsin 7-dehydrogenase n=1 Tax=Pontiella desulfatans TaxID=2750659 RepID=A0A6C2U1W6_PONDE|nr:SDR family oxidoreductase [Pontiella desulfatans]VGO13867.1 Dihydroanticapsin 7-dehydrogenase [Pontiella desulfatans]